MATQGWTTNLIRPLVETDEIAWFAVQTQARHEKKVSTLLREQKVETFLPLIAKLQRWSDRRRWIEFPLFACYTFVHIRPNSEERARVLRTPGVFSIVGTSTEPLSIPEKQIEDVRRLLQQKVRCWEYPFLNVGRRVRVRGGCLEGIEGILVEIKSNRTLVISADPIQRSIAISIDDYEVESV